MPGSRYGQRSAAVLLSACGYWSDDRKAGPKVGEFLLDGVGIVVIAVAHTSRRRRSFDSASLRSASLRMTMGSLRSLRTTAGDWSPSPEGASHLPDKASTGLRPAERKVRETTSVSMCAEGARIFAQAGRNVIRVIGRIENVEVIARGSSLRERNRLAKAYGRGSWRKLKGTAHVELPDGARISAEIHWYEAHGIGRKEFKIKRLLE